MDSETIRIGRDRLLRVFRYLEALNEHRNPVKRHIGEQLWSQWLKNMPDHPSIRRGSSPAAELSALVASGDGPPVERQDSDFILKIARPRLTNPPTPPALIESWLEPGWEDPFKEVSPPRNETSAGIAAHLRFGSDPERLEALAQWKVKRNQWAKDEQPARTAMKTFEDFYELYGRMEREAERVEIVLGDGILSWHRPEGTVRHPILLQRLQLSFSPSVPEFTLRETEHPVELYSALFQSMPDVDGRAIGRCRDELEAEGYSPLDDGPTSAFLERLVVQLSPRGEFVESGAPEGETDDPRIGRQPVLFLRPRTLGFAAAIEAVLEDLRNRNDMPWSLLNIVGLEPPAPEVEVPDRRRHRITEDAEILLSKPANPEQIRIARQLKHSGGVLVQGPPGTGKTYTIGNLIGHLLAEGKSVLVTSHTTKALRMVRSQIVPELRSLAVSLLENDLDSRMQLESAVSIIADRLSKTDAKSLESKADGLRQERAKLLSRLEELRQQLATARSDEYRDVVVGGKSWQPSEAARKIARESEVNGWIPGPLQADIDLPLSGGELAELYATNRSISPDVESELSGQLPGPGELPSPADFEDLLLERAGLERAKHEFRSDLWRSGNGHASADSLQEIAIKLKQSVDVLATGERWKLSAVYAGKNGGAHRETWEKLLSLIEQAHLEAAGAQEILIQHATTLPDELLLEQHEQTATEIHGHLRSGGNLGFFSLLTHRRWKQFIQTTQVDGDEPKLPDHFLAASKFSRVKRLRKNLAVRWDRQMAPLGASASAEMGTEIEKAAIQFCGPIRDCLAWHSQIWSPVEKELRQTGFLWDKFVSEQPVVVGDDGELRRLRSAVIDALPPIVASRADHLKRAEINQKLVELRERLTVALRSFPGSHSIANLREAVESLDSRAYRRGHTRLLELHELRFNLQRRNVLLARLETAAPAWAVAIRARTGAHASANVPGDPSRAWVWRQIQCELDRRASVSIDELQTSIERVAVQLRATTIDLIDNLAWMFQARRTSLPQRQALIGWLDTIRKIGKGTGIRAPRLRAEAAHKMTECWGAVPVWVMPLSRVVENFDPGKSRFDVVIIDEASQSDVMALVALYLGHNVVVVGDHEQVSPSAVGQEAAVIQHLIDQFLQGIPNAHLYDGQTSVYDLARQSFGETVRLVEHFRCVSEIIQFSNQLSYDGDIKTLRDASHVRLRPHVLAYPVTGSTRDGKVNRPEAKVVASLIAAALEQTEYQTNEFGSPSSIGVVSLVGEEQALEIDRLLRTHLAPDAYERHRLLCGTSAQFQGDERDVVFLSIVDAPAGGVLHLRDQQMFKQRYNVAASRARDQMWVVHSLDPQTDLQPGDLRRRLIEHAQAPELLTRTFDNQETNVQSALERDVMKRLAQAGYHVIPRWKVGSRSIDLVVEGNGKRLAIECDGDRDLPLEKLHDDIERQSMLERLGWTFARVRGSIFFREPNRAMTTLFDKLQSLEISSMGLGRASDRASGSSHLSELTERVMRRAEELRDEWSALYNKRRLRSHSSESLR